MSGCVRERELATAAFTWDDVKTESALLYCPHSSVHLITVPTQGQVSGGDTQNVLGPHLHERGIHCMKLYRSNNGGNKGGCARVRVSDEVSDES